MPPKELQNGSPLLGALIAGAALLHALAACAAQEQTPPDRLNHGKQGISRSTTETPTRRDCLGDALPRGALARLGTIQLHHHGLILSTALSPDGRLVASSGG